MRSRPFAASLALLQLASSAQAGDSSLFTDALGEAKIISLLRAGDPSERRRGFERLGLPLLPLTRERLLSEIQRVESLTYLEKRTLISRLAPYASEPAVAVFLYRIMSDASDPDPALTAELQRSVALVLARSRGQRATSLLVTALRYPGPLAEAAEIGLKAYPPKDLGVFLQENAPHLGVKLVGEIGGRTSLAGLRHLVETAPMEASLEAAVAMVKLKNSEPLSLAREWAKSSSLPVRLAALEILLRVSLKEGEALFAALLEDETSHHAALERILALPGTSPGLVTALRRKLTKAPPDVERKIRAHLATIDSEAAAQAVVLAPISKGELVLGAHDLATSPTSAALKFMRTRLGETSGFERRLWVRALLVRELRYGDTQVAFAELGEELIRSAAPEDQALGYFVRAAHDPKERVAGMHSNNQLEVSAAVAWAGDAETCTLAADRLKYEPNPSLRLALARCLVNASAWPRLSTDALLALLSDPATAPTAALALGARFDAGRPIFEALLESGDPKLRAAAWLGLSQSQWPERFARLTRAYDDELNHEVRAAIVSGLSTNSPPPPQWVASLMALARQLDGSELVRAVAPPPFRESPSPEAVKVPSHALLPIWVFVDDWKSVRPTAPPPAPTVSKPPGAPGGQELGEARELSVVQVTVAPGVTLPFVPDLDGMVLVPGLAHGSYSARLALGSPREAPRPPRLGARKPE